MGSPLEPGRAKNFLCRQEGKRLRNSSNILKPVFYKRYNDSTFALFKKPRHVALFDAYMNKKQ